MNRILLPTSYLGNVAYYAYLYHAEEVVFEACEHYQKQSFRNRCTIYGANGRLDLIVPIIRKSGVRQLISEMQISYSEDWQKVHWKSFEAAYRSSPYFEYYEHEFRKYYETEYATLLQWNNALQKWVLEKLDLSIMASETSQWEAQPADITDLRNAFNPKSPNPAYLKEVEYGQVFENKHGFLENLSIADLLFNEGPAASSVLADIQIPA